MRIYPGYIKTNGGDTPRAATAISYTVVIDFGGKVGAVEYQNVQPNGYRPDPAVVDTLPRPVGYPFLATVAVEGQAAVIHFDEIPAFEPCSQPPPINGRLPRAGP